MLTVAELRIVDHSMIFEHICDRAVSLFMEVEMLGFDGGNVYEAFNLRSKMISICMCSNV